MSIRPELLASAASAGVLLVGWQVGTANGAHVAPSTTDPDDAHTTTATTAGTPTTATTAPASGARTTAPTARTSQPVTGATPTQAATTAPAGLSGTFTGTPATHHFGSITVTVTLNSGRITGLTYTSAGEMKNQRYESMAIPQLKAAVLAAQSTKVSTISGATLTSQAYLTSLQSALDQAGVR